MYFQVDEGVLVVGLSGPGVECVQHSVRGMRRISDYYTITEATHCDCSMVSYVPQCLSDIIL